MKKYTNPYIDILLFDEEEDILTTSGSTTTTGGYTAAQDVAAQMENVIGSGAFSIDTVRLEDIQITQ